MRNLNEMDLNLLNGDVSLSKNEQGIGLHKCSSLKENCPSNLEDRSSKMDNVERNCRNVFPDWMKSSNPTEIMNPIPKVPTKLPTSNSLTFFNTSNTKPDNTSNTDSHNTFNTDSPNSSFHANSTLYQELNSNIHENYPIEKKRMESHIQVDMFSASQAENISETMSSSSTQTQSDNIFVESMGIDSPSQTSYIQTNPIQSILDTLYNRSSIAIQQSGDWFLHEYLDTFSLHDNDVLDTLNTDENGVDVGVDVGIDANCVPLGNVDMDTDMDAVIGMNFVRSIEIESDADTLIDSKMSNLQSPASTFPTGKSFNAKGVDCSDLLYPPNEEFASRSSTHEQIEEECTPSWMNYMSTESFQDQDNLSDPSNQDAIHLHCHSDTQFISPPILPNLVSISDFQGKNSSNALLHQRRDRANIAPFNSFSNNMYIYPKYFSSSIIDEQDLQDNSPFRSSTQMINGAYIQPLLNIRNSAHSSYSTTSRPSPQNIAHVGVQNSISVRKRKRDLKNNEISAITVAISKRNRTAGTQTSLSLDPISMKTQSTQTQVAKRCLPRQNKSIQTRNSNLKVVNIPGTPLPSCLSNILLCNRISGMQMFDPQSLEYYSMISVLSARLSNAVSVKSTTAVLQCWSPNNTLHLPILIRDKYYHTNITFQRNAALSNINIQKLPFSLYPNIRKDYESDIRTCVGKDIYLYVNISVFNLNNGKVVTSRLANSQPQQFLEIEDILSQLSDNKEEIELSFHFKFHGSFLGATILKSTQELKNHLVTLTFSLVVQSNEQSINSFAPLASTSFTFRPKSKTKDCIQKILSIQLLQSEQIPTNVPITSISSTLTHEQRTPIQAISLAFITHMNLSGTMITDVDLKYILFNHENTVRTLIINDCVRISGVVSTSTTSEDHIECVFPQNVHILRVKNVPLTLSTLQLMSETLLNVNWDYILEDLGMEPGTIAI